MPRAAPNSDRADRAAPVAPVGEPGRRFRHRTPPSAGIEPRGRTDVRHPAKHPDAPARRVDRAVMEPAQQHAVVGVGGSAVGVGDDVVDLAPRGGHGASGNQASAVAQGDRAALVRREAPLGRPEADDATLVAEDDRLGAAGADHVAGSAERDRELDPVGVRDAAAGREVGGPDADEHRRRSTADRGMLPRARRGVDRGGQHVVALLVGRATLAGLGEARAFLVGVESQARARRQVRVEEPRELRRDLGHEVARDGHQSVSRSAEPAPRDVASPAPRRVRARLGRGTSTTPAPGHAVRRRCSAPARRRRCRWPRRRAPARPSRARQGRRPCGCGRVRG